MHARLALALVSLVVVVSQTKAQDEPTHSLELDAGPALHLGGDVCQRTLSDVVACTADGSFGPFLAARWRFSDNASVGAFGAFGQSSVPRGDSSQTRLAAQFRWIPFGDRFVDLWVGPDAGLVHVADDVPAGELGPPISYSTTAPSLGIAAGIGIVPLDWLELGLMVRTYADFLGTSEDLRGRQPQRQTRSGLAVALLLTLRP
jgi:hypothetical protein